jgi:hypothetical protein
MCELGKNRMNPEPKINYRSYDEAFKRSACNSAIGYKSPVDFETKLN